MPKPIRPLSLVLLVLSAVPLFAAPQSTFGPALRRVLRQMAPDGMATLTGVALRDDRLDTIELEPMQVWARDAKIVVYGPAGEETILPPPPIRYFKGRVAGEDSSAVFLSMSEDGSIRGIILLGERHWSVASGVRRAGRPINDDETPVLTFEPDPIDELADPAAKWSCAATGAGGMPHIRAHELSLRQKPVPNAGNVSGATYQLRIAFETDNEFCAAFGNNNTTISTYIGDLLGKASVVYQRDLSTTLVIGQVNLRSAGTDPWTVTPSTPSPGDSALSEFAAYWHTNYSFASVPRSSAVFLSGKNFGGGIAWIGDMLCGDDFFCGADATTATNNCGSSVYTNSYAGAYAFAGSGGSVETSVPDPTLTQNGVQYGMPTTNFNMLQAFMHELGHNANGPHTHCVALTAGEKTLYNVTRNYVDECAQQGGCFIGTPSVPTEKGTTMSYCNLFFSGGFPQSRYMFGKAGEPSEKMLALFHTALETITPDGTITAQTPPVACSAGRTASVPTCSGCTYSWQISGGTINSGSTTNAITYTPSSPSVTLTATIVMARGCGITTSKTIATSCAALSAPTGVVAAATSTTAVGVSWNTVSGATSYNVYRSANGSTYTLAGSTSGLSLSDGGRTANTAYLYKVRASNGSESPDSNIDLATTTIFTDDPVVNDTTLLKMAHITELRTAVNAVRTLAGLGGGTYTDSGLTVNTPIKAAHITDLRSALDAARSLLALGTLSYGDTITASTTKIRGSHVTELRNGVK